MSDSITISKTNPDYPSYLNFARLRPEGIQYLEKLSGKLWTDFNAHDPGVTILEVLCYAITDLGYRTNLDIETLLAKKNGETEDTNFYTPAQILGCNPLTLLDYRKLLLDIPGVRNAWLELSDQSEIAIGVDCAASILKVKDDDSPEIKIRGLYNILLELESVVKIDSCGKEETSTAPIIEAVKKTFHAHRNLTEDLLSILVLGEEQIGLCMDLELENNASAEEILTEIFVKVAEFIAPVVKFYTLQEMLDKGSSCEKIFEGRPLSQTSHGFIDSEELENLTLKNHIHASDIYQIILDIKGVQSIKKLLLLNYINDLPFTEGEKWCLKLTPNYKAMLDPKLCKIRFFKGHLMNDVNTSIAVEKFEEQSKAIRKAYLPPHLLDVSIPYNASVDIESYTSIHHDFPLLYGIGENGLPDSASSERKAQAKQLKAYLLFFDQLLANYLSQLAGIRDLFSMSSNVGSPTYFSQVLTNVPEANELISNYYSCASEEDRAAYLDDPLDYKDYLNLIAESKDTSNLRKNKLLDHLMSRFSEQFTDYVMLMFTIKGDKYDEKRIIQEKMDFLREYPGLSQDRGKAFNYTLQAETWDTKSNISGFQKRVSKLVGMDDYSRRDINKCHVIKNTQGYSFSIVDQDGNILLESVEHYPTEKEAQEVISNIQLLGKDIGNYVRLEGDNFNRYTLSMSNGIEHVHFEDKFYFNSIAERKFAITQIQEYFQGHTPEEMLESFVVESVNNKYYFSIKFLLPENELPYSLRSESEFYHQGEARKAGRSFLLSLLPGIAEGSAFIEKEQSGFIRYGFGIQDAQKNLIATNASSLIFENVSVRDLKLLQALAYFKSPDLVIDIMKVNDSYYYEMRDQENTATLLESAIGYTTALLAEEAFASMKNAAAEFINFVKINNADGTFGFEIHSSGERLAIGKLNYTSLTERDNSIYMVYYYLNKPATFGQIIENKAFSFYIFNTEFGLTLKSDAGFETKEIAEEKYSEALKLASVKSNYILLDHLQIHGKYSFELVNHRKEVVAILFDSGINARKTFKSRIERNLTLKNFIQLFAPGEVVPSVIEFEGGFLFQLTDTSNRKLLISKKIYESIEAAQHALTQCQDLAKIRTNYILLNEVEDCSFGFQLMMGEEIIAVHPMHYPGENERNLSLDLILILLTKPAIEVKYEDEIQSYTSVLTDGTEVYFESKNTFAKRSQADTGLNEIVESAKLFKNYLILDDKRGKRFNLSNSAGDVIAIHPNFYTTEYDLTSEINRIIYFVSGFTPLKNIVATKGSYYFEIHDKEGQILLVGKQNYKQKDAAQKAATHTIELAIQRDSYQTISDDSSSCKWGIEVMDENKQVIAFHPSRFNALQEVHAKIDQIREFVIPGQWEIEPVDYYNFNLTHFGKDLFVSNHLFTSQVDAQVQFNAFLQFAKQRKNYYPSLENNLCLDVYDNDGRNKIANGLQEYAVNVQEDKLEEIIGYLNQKTYAYAINENEAFYTYVLQDPSGKILLESNQKYSEEKSAAQGYEDLLSFLKAAESIEIREVEQENICQFSLVVVSTQKEIIAAHPIFYTSYSEAEKQRKDIYLNVNAPRTKYRIIEGGGDYVFEIFDPEGEVVIFRSYNSFVDKKGALESYKDFQFAAADIHNYKLTSKDEDCDFSFVVVNAENKILATHLICYLSSKERDAALSSHYIYLSNTSIVHEILFSPKSYSFEIKDDLQNTILISNKPYAKSELAMIGMEDVIQRGQSKENFSYYNQRIQVLDAGKQPVAVSVLKFAENGQADQEVQRIISLLISPQITYEIAKVETKYQLVLRDYKSDILLFQEELLSSLEHAQIELLKLEKLSKEKKNYKLLYDNGACINNSKNKYGFMLMDGLNAVVALHPLKYEERTVRDGKIKYVLDLLTKVEPSVNISGTDSAFYYSFSSKKTLEGYFSSYANFPTPARALEHAIDVISMMTHQENFYVIKEEDKFNIKVVAENNLFIGKFNFSFSTQEEATIKIDTLVYSIVPHFVNYKILPLAIGFHFQIQDDKFSPLLTGIKNFLDKREAEKEVKRLLQNWKAEVLFDDKEDGQGEKTFGFNVVNSAKEVIAFHTYYYKTKEQRTLAQEAVRSYLQSSEALSKIKLPNASNTYSFILSDKDKIYLEGINYYSSTSGAWDATGEFMENVQNEDCYRVITMKGACYSQDYFIEILDNEKNTLARGTSTYTADELDTAKKSMMALANREGFHLLEHILLRPKNIGCTPQYFFKLTDDLGEDLLVGTTNYTTLQQAIEGYYLALDLMEDAGNFISTIDNTTEQDFNFILVNKQSATEVGIPIAKNAHPICDLNEYDKSIKKITAYVAANKELLKNNLVKLYMNNGTDRWLVGIQGYDTLLNPQQRTEEIKRYKNILATVSDISGFKIKEIMEGAIWTFTIHDKEEKEVFIHPYQYGSEELVKKAISKTKEMIASIEHFPLRFTSSIINLTDVSAPFQETESFLPVCLTESDCNEISEECLVYADPYSFRATVVLPYWPERFRNIQFRRYLENLLRQEAPAHVFLRVCWINPEQMATFEQYYHRWLDDMATNSNAYNACTYTDSLNGLVDILGKLRNIYPTATLHNCDETGNGNSIILNQTILGTANTNTNGN